MESKRAERWISSIQYWNVIVTNIGHSDGGVDRPSVNVHGSGEEELRWGMSEAVHSYSILETGVGPRTVFGAGYNYAFVRLLTCCHLQCVPTLPQ